MVFINLINDTFLTKMYISILAGIYQRGSKFKLITTMHLK